jgi:hypothetical protein
MLIFISPFLAGAKETLFASGIEFSNTHSSGSTAYHPSQLFSWLATYFKSGAIDRTAFFALTCFPSLMRFIISAIFVGSFLSRPLIMRPVSLVWARIVESDKPVFALIFGGTAAFATAISEAAKHL